MNIVEIIEKSKDISKWTALRQSSTYRKCATCTTGQLHSLMECYDNYCIAYNSPLSPYPEVPVTPDELKSCIDFANRSDYGKWSTRGATCLKKLKEDNTAGKVGEFVVRNTLVELGVEVTPPDLGIYEVHDKSFDADLTMALNGKANGISVKTFRIRDGKPANVSWVIQKKESTGRGGTDRHFFGGMSERQDQWFAGVALSPDLRHGRILAFLPMQTLYDADIYQMLEVRNGTIENTKRAIYWNDLQCRGLLPQDIGGLPFPS